MLLQCMKILAIILVTFFCDPLMAKEFSKEQKLYYREKVKSMFYHAYNGYLNYAYPLDELRPLTCSGMDTWGSFSLTLIDALDTLIIMGNHTEFIRAVDLVLKNVNVDENVNVSVFETNIRVVGGLLSAHMLSSKIEGYELHPGWPCAGPLLDLAERFAAKLLPAFNTPTGMPYGTVNLKYGVHELETPITCTACVGSFILEFGTLSRLTGNPHYERVALKALKGLWESRSTIGLVGNHINVETGVWTATDAGIGAGVDSYFEYLVKGSLFFQRPLLMHQFYEYEKAINEHVRKDDWFVWVTMTKGQVTLPIFQSLEAFWPSILTLIGKVEDASRIMFGYNQILRQYGLPPEFYNLPNREAHSTRSGYPLRPEIIESLLYLYKALEDPHYLHISAAFVETIERTSKTKCGYATIRTVGDFTLEDRMESFFLSETTKYLYLIFDDDSFIHNDGSTAKRIETTDGSCIIDAGGYIFNTEAHPLDPGIIYCCGAKRQNDTAMLRRFEENIDFLSLLDLQNLYAPQVDEQLEEMDLDQETIELNNINNEFTTLSNSEEKLLNENQPGAKKEDKLILTKEDSHLLSPNNDQEEETKSTTDKPEKVDSEDEEIPKQTLSEKFREAAKEAAKNTKLENADLKSILNEIIKKWENRPLSVKGEPFVQALCDQCCVLLNQFQKGSLALRRMASAIYGKYLNEYDNAANIRFVQGPVCSLMDNRSMANWKLPSLTPLYKNTPPDMAKLEPEHQKHDVVSDYSFSSISYQKLVAERHNLLTSPSRAFYSNFIGMGQIV